VTEPFASGSGWITSGTSGRESEEQQAPIVNAKKQHNKKFSFCTLQVCLTFEFRNEFFGFEKVTLSTSRNGRTQGTEIIFHCLSVLFQVLGVFV
jgi:hypothetical protein